MSAFKRLSAIVSGSLDQAINQIENQDAVIDVILKDARTALAAAKVRLHRVEQDAKKMQAEQATLKEAVSLWEARAKRLGADDADRAIECLRQRKLCAEQLQALNARAIEHGGVISRLAADVTNAEATVSNIQIKQNVMRTRESAASASQSIAQIEQGSNVDLAATFDRWETKIIESELIVGGGPIESVRPFEQDFLKQEEEDALRKELAALTADMGVDDVKGDGHE